MLQLTTVLFLISISIFSAIHWLALNFFLYWKFPWFDMAMHFLGGAVLALGFLSLKDIFNRIPDRLQYFLPIMAGVLVACLLWELIELKTGLLDFFATDFEYKIDTLTDIIFGLLGGFISFMVGHSVRKL